MYHHLEILEMLREYYLSCCFHFECLTFQTCGSIYSAHWYIVFTPTARAYVVWHFQVKSLCSKWRHLSNDSDNFCGKCSIKHRINKILHGSERVTIFLSRGIVVGEENHSWPAVTRDRCWWGKSLVTCGHEWFSSPTTIPRERKTVTRSLRRSRVIFLTNNDPSWEKNCNSLAAM